MIVEFNQIWSVELKPKLTRAKRRHHMNLGRDKLTQWNQDIWKQIDNTVHDEAKRTRIAMKFIPLFMTTADAKTVPSDTIDTGDPATLTVDEGLETTIFEISVGFALT